jgi:hypothetical protein
MSVKKPPAKKKKMNGLSRYEKLMYHLCMYIFIMFLCVSYMNVSVCVCSVVLLIRLIVFRFENFGPCIGSMTFNTYINAL